jgi:subtilisin family serine protease
VSLRPGPDGTLVIAPGVPVALGERVAVRGAGEISLDDLLASAGANVDVELVVSERPLRVVLRTEAGARAALRTADALMGAGLVDYAVPELVLPMELRSRRVPDDPLFGRQWHLENTGQGGRVVDADIDAPEAWAYTRGSRDVTIAVLDDGVQLDHPDLVPNIRSPGRDFAAAVPADDAAPRRTSDRHGTSVAGVAAARGDNGTGVTGVCPECTILPVRVHGSSNLATAAAFRYAVEQGADVITNSWGYTALPIAADDAVRDAIDTAAREGRDGRGAVVVFGMTNAPVDNCSGPTVDISSLESVIAVGVADHNDQIGGSGFGDCMDLVAPAKPRYRSTIGITTTDRTGLDGHVPGDYFEAFGGTSAAAPIVAGIAGLMLSVDPALTGREVKEILEATADKIDPAAARYDASGFSARAGHGRVNAARALAQVVERLAARAAVAGGAAGAAGGAGTAGSDPE